MRERKARGPKALGERLARAANEPKQRVGIFEEKREGAWFLPFVGKMAKGDGNIPTSFYGLGEIQAGCYLLIKSVISAF